MLRIEEMSPADLSEVVAIEELSFTNPWTRGMFMVEMTLPQSRTVVIRAEESGGANRIAGYACWWNVAGEIHILDIAVHPDFRCLGHATKLAKTILDEARGSNAEKIFLEVRASNLSARKFYRKLGFRETGLRPRYYDKPIEDAVCMTLELMSDGNSLR